MSAPIERLAAAHVGHGEGVCTGCGDPDVNDPCDQCFSEQWAPACVDCQGEIGPALARLGSLRCQDCRDTAIHHDTLRRAA